ncbi:hypothetical protein HN865_00755 [Candidatus Woesearchaeota archaeon]|jgi:hypothetical protein|nr:hypothetical protein [Candidatus Woesearchaeota archaeon]MBT7237369.1 hypothetical protein [Candidatus Woesearchaeota archaeon]
MHGCKGMGIIIPLIVIVFTLWEPAAWTKWLVVASGLVLLLHVFKCKACDSGSCVDEKQVKDKK